jgi:hypothetical protein
MAETARSIAEGYRGNCTSRTGTTVTTSTNSFVFVVVFVVVVDCS